MKNGSIPSSGNFLGEGDLLPQKTNVLNSRYNLHLPRLTTKFSRCERKAAEKLQFHRPINTSSSMRKKAFSFVLKTYFSRPSSLFSQQIQIIPHMLRAAMYWMLSSVPSAFSSFWFLITYTNSKAHFNHWQLVPFRTKRSLPLEQSYTKSLDSTC